MSEKLIFLLQRTLRKTWLRCTFFALFAVIAVVLATLLGPYIDEDVALKLGSDAIGSLLNILASSMLTVAIFSASTMVSSFGAVASSATPRASQLLIEDSTIQNTLAAFIGAFVYSIIALVGLHAHVYGDGGRLVLFGFTLIVLVLVVIVLLRWIDYLSVLGRLGETIRRVEAATRKAMDQRIDKPYLGGVPQRAGDRGAHPLMAPTTGFVLHVSMDLLQAQAEKLGLRLHLHVLPGHFVEPGTPILSADGPVDAQASAALCDAVSIGPARTFDHDPRFGLVVMGEIAARSLSAAVNDPGTSFDVMATAVKVLSYWTTAMGQRGEDAQAPQFDRIAVPGIHEAGMVEDVFAPIARYGAGAVEIGITLQRALRSVARLDGNIAVAASAMSTYAMQRAVHAGLPQVDLDALRHSAAWAQGAAPIPARAAA
ncbi:DUF2254 domain-containing protein [Pseudorhodoferax sp. Leaf267]|uniref:DUF2254 domain-containing protein n=1 Tax=Pseudorhodoferax sp. Leaf267 TaxID=1736316 RepID=UPI0006F35FBA|nr:DUF2254 domain-containing protein [Pseudorhodoferax sp. Leaf267]KQP22681.1 hypothetical protein ASF43_01860 [Pseudorhodoferax sp. Leaf267]